MCWVVLSLVSKGGARKLYLGRKNSVSKAREVGKCWSYLGSEKKLAEPVLRLILCHLGRPWGAQMSCQMLFRECVRAFLCEVTHDEWTA